MEPKSGWDQRQSRTGPFYWEKQVQGTLPMPEFLELRSKGLAKMEGDTYFIKKEGIDPVLIAALKKMDEEISRKVREMQNNIDKLSPSEVQKLR